MKLFEKYKCFNINYIFLFKSQIMDSLQREAEEWREQLIFERDTKYFFKFNYSQTSTKQNIKKLLL